MTTPAERAVDRLSRRLRRLDGVVNLRRTRAAESAESIDFDLGFPEGSMVEISRERSAGIGKTSVIVGPGGMVDTFLIRYPPLPADDFAEPQLLSDMHEIAAIRLPEKHLDIRIQPGRMQNMGTPEGVTAWWPHVEYRGIAPVEVAVDDFADFLAETYREYKSRYFDPAKTVY